MNRTDRFVGWVSRPVLYGVEQLSKPLPDGSGEPSYLGVVLDWAERLSVLALYGWLVFRIVAAYTSQGGAENLILMASEGLVVLLLLIRRRAQQLSRRPVDWVLAYVGTAGPLLVQPAAGSAAIPPAAAGIVMLAGILLQLAAKLSLGRSYGIVAANRGVKSSGPYRWLRHPMYAGYLLTHLGFLAANATAWNVIVYAICYLHQLPRLLAEERLLRRDPQYRQYMQSVPHRLIPGVF